MAKRPDIPDSHYAPWELAFGRILTPFEEFIHQETAGSMVLIACTVLALAAANSPLSDTYEALLHTHLVITLGSWTLDHTLHHWINDGLMALFFFVVGLEIKREVVVGELSDPRAAALPIVAALGGMAVPAIIYALFNAGGEGARGWGIPMATDIAFAIGVLALLGNRVPKTLYTFLVALAIVDDLGAVAVIAIFYTERIVGEALAAAGACLGVLMVFNLAGVRSAVPHFAVSVLLWLAMLESGVHATVAGVLAAWTIPSRPKLDPARFSEHVRGLMDRFDGMAKDSAAHIHGPEQRAIVQAVESGIHRVESPLQRLEHAMHTPVAFFVIPLFALANAGVPIDLGTVGNTLAGAVPLGIVCGLVAGKLLGIAGLGMLAVKLGVAELPRGCRAVHIVGVSLLAGIGFTMSIFIAELAFRGQPELIIAAKTGILLASLVSGIAGYLWLRTWGHSESPA
ncbi:MAG: Na+/H+ antiporter NhaA [Gammaproteobacteria bacterium]|nr:Na+/H+ antiporter NhaA [Gammaproteobacteria bacterium]NIR85732.1 Na+/H+ antiporter NhaA [Gammaproteobacteria bacterium]NIR90265.1 Na+/H+ antiporter NhaA [Gammaproteobacteria bacterium]NIU06866.1 Na+/H+ antiporter NhaA [Gammaproteobacteria bacterium]NIV53799.1 Na+/H+ antiporter NhaA [Gammaproteobacteria bacterium]